MPGNPNRKHRMEALNPVERNLNVPVSGEVAKDGYTVTGRRPRYHGADIVDTDRADRIEGMFNDFDLDDSY